MQSEAQTTTRGFLAVTAGALEIAIVIQGALEVWSLYPFLTNDTTDFGVKEVGDIKTLYRCIMLLHLFDIVKNSYNKAMYICIMLLHLFDIVNNNKNKTLFIV